MSTKQRIYQLTGIIRRNYPDHPSTFADCENGCGNSARGGGLCASCAAAHLQLLLPVSGLADDFHRHTRLAAGALDKMLNIED